METMNSLSAVPSSLVKKLTRDLFAGLTVAAIAVPQAMAYAQIAGIHPEYGLYTAIVLPIIGAIFGSSSQLIAGPTNAISILVFSAVAGVAGTMNDPKHIQVVCLLALLAGFIQLLIALLRLGDMTRYVSESVILGFMAAAGILVALGQVQNLLGLSAQGNGQQHFLFRLWLTLRDGGPVNIYALAVGLGTILTVILFRSLGQRLGIMLPDMLIALLLAALLVWAFDRGTDAPGLPLIPVVGEVPRRLPPFDLPALNRGDWIRQLSLSASAIALLGLVESVAIAKSIAIYTRQKLDFNRQCMAEGLANIAGSCFHCMPGSGSLTRSAVNHHAGAVTRWSGIFSAVAVAVVLLLFAPLAHYIPRSALAGILMVTVWKLIDRKRLQYCFRATRFDAGIAMATAFSGIFIGIEFSILIGTFLSFLFFVPRAARLQWSELVVAPDRVLRERHPDDPQCTKMALFSLEGELFFGAAPELEECLEELEARVDGGTRIIVLRLKRARNPDMVCLEHLERFLSDMQAKKVTVLLCGVRKDFATALRSLRFHHWLPSECIFFEEVAAGSSTLRAVRKAYEVLGNDRCPTCPRSMEASMPQGDWYYVI